MFKPVPTKVDFPALERDILLWWQEEGMIERYLRRNQSSPHKWSFIDGPITANNPMGVHHAWGRAYKDIYQRFKTMQGFRQRYQNGFDCQGLWIEVEVEREMGFKSKRDIEEFGIDRFVEACKDRVRRFSEIQTEQSIRLGYWMDWDNSYYTFSDENNYTIWHFLKRCHEEGWLYKGHDVMPWCPRCATGLSQHEIVTEGYRELTHPSVYLKFPLKGRNKESLLVWTTTPWTLSSNTAAAVHPEFTYVRVRQGDETYYLARAALAALQGKYEELGELKGEEMVGWTYHGPYDELPPQQGVEHRIVPWEEVSETEGTGIVHIAPGCGKADFLLSKQFDLAVIAPLDEAGNFLPGFDWLSGRNVADVTQPVFDDLARKGILYRTEDYTHRYPVCWRCDSELVFRLVDEWFISMDTLRHRIAAVTKRIHWIPEFGLARELDWLENMEDWMISKKRYYGLALPIYECGECGNIEVIGGEEELRERACEGWKRFERRSPHRPWIDAVKIRCPKCDQVVSRIPDVGNPWLDAGIVPYSTLHYRHDRDYWQEWFPADWISESFPGQFRNWFYSLLAMSTVLEDHEPFRACFGYALLRDEKGEEMHKSKGNAIWFDDAAERMGVDVMRWLFARHNPTTNLNFGWHSGDDIRRGFILTLWNTYSFFVTYANIDRFVPEGMNSPEATVDLDRWILSGLNQLIDKVTASLEEFDSMTVTRLIEAFVEDLSNWYVRRSRRRFWKSEDDADKRTAYQTLHTCLVTLCKLLAPIVPFLAEEMYQNLVRSHDNEAPESVHLCDWPKPDMSMVDERLDGGIRLVMRLVSLGRSARSKAGIKVRQPLGRAFLKVRARSEEEGVRHLAAQIQDELNVKELALVEDEGEFVSYQVKPNPAALGPKHGRELEAISRELQAVDPREVATIVSRGEPVVVGEWTLEPGEVEVAVKDREGFATAAEYDYLVAIPTEITRELADEGLARELVHRLQTMRRNAGFDIADRIVTYYQDGDDIRRVMEDFGEYVRQETLSRELVEGEPPPDAHREEHRIDGHRVRLAVRRA
jgi:isoleucyl-tRNA synthetase